MMLCTVCNQEMEDDETGIYSMVLYQGGHIVCMYPLLQELGGEG
jgi:hypothetical protein